jgi:hypothetical protein
VLQEKATEIALRLKISNFEDSNGWLQQFKKCHDISSKNVCGESGSVTEDIVNNWKVSLPGFLQGYTPKNIFNAYETGLYYNLLPSKTLSMKGESCHNGRKGKEYLTKLLCCNYHGTEKLKPLENMHHQGVLTPQRGSTCSTHLAFKCPICGSTYNERTAASLISLAHK